MIAVTGCPRISGNRLIGRSAPRPQLRDASDAGSRCVLLSDAPWMRRVGLVKSTREIRCRVGILMPRRSACLTVQTSALRVEILTKGPQMFCGAGARRRCDSPKPQTRMRVTASQKDVPSLRLEERSRRVVYIHNSSQIPRTLAPLHSTAVDLAPSPQDFDFACLCGFTPSFRVRFLRRSAILRVCEPAKNRTR